MPGFLLAMTLVTDAILVMIAVRSLKLMNRIRTRFARLQATMVALLCAAGVVASVQDIGFQATELGWISESVGRHFVGRVQAALVVGGLAVLAPVMWILRKLTAEFAVHEALADSLVNRLPAGLTAESAGLTPREIEVVSAIGDGSVSDREIAEKLTVSPATAATHVRNIMRKTGIKRRGDLALLALEIHDDA
ncbi:MAG: LuxR C-terminal-related transcriptional regulator [Acidimicrobiia bacterium]|nr:LuxR C-terminal-related transcriptional regulator [Acidimicrobiia bacterium]